MSGYPGEWAVAFHGVTNPSKCLKEIMSGLNIG
jgi:hypothetical protein